ncbi:sugar transferase [Aureisphaera galaxeae]|uniref:sugar transferase n=1 Tax=Aureisphaera galaxeae TaxID=1538023 RepID=UPI00235061B0|nr:sugar transferase [Aureisphaera galaxeae]MDC8006275.1 sugar transferase [Aureisphaera galaxeae]
MLTPTQKSVKRIFDLSISIIVLPFVIFPLILLLLIAWLSTGKNGLFVQVRIGMHGKAFKLLKIRSLKGERHADILEMKEHETKFGTWLRRSKLDELPQLFNIIKGEMSWVGPRPDIPGYADELKGEDRIVLSVRPGLTGPATIKYRNEDALLLKQQDPKTYNDEVIWPDKVNINKEYIKQWSLRKDINYIWASITKR